MEPGASGFPYEHGGGRRPQHLAAVMRRRLVTAPTAYRWHLLM
ncbi:hypothetical protein L842_4176 [Mycobacterium intracellulare MIN_052511_1280]|nr:hypothetical protein L842_4176 [Mycobacterium intracellulare MIN_052511_1280]